MLKGVQSEFNCSFCVRQKPDSAMAHVVGCLSSDFSVALLSALSVAFCEASMWVTVFSLQRLHEVIHVHLCSQRDHLLKTPLPDGGRAQTPCSLEKTSLLFLCSTSNLQRVSLEFYIDVHAHSTMLNGFMYGNVFEDEERVQRQAVFPRLLCQNAPDFSFSNTSFNRDVVKAGTGRRFLGGLLDDTSYCYTLEVSFYSFMTAGSTAPVPYTEETYMKLGRNVARTFLDYYKLSNLIKDNRPLHIQSSEGGSPTANSTAAKAMSVGRDTTDRRKEANQNARH
uniref:AGBL carboxypeptidase 4 n=1 Tax=Oryzias latipes TaxID=8090 RepID=A0A3B3ILS5_ORYLA